MVEWTIKVQWVKSKSIIKTKWPNITKKSTDCAFYLSNSSAVIDHYTWEFKWHYNCIRKQIIFLQQLFRTSGIHNMFVQMVGCVYKLYTDELLQIHKRIS